MNAPKHKYPRKAVLIVGGSFLFLALLFIGFTPILSRRISNPETSAKILLFQSQTWWTKHSNLNTTWEASDGSTVKTVSAKSTDNGIDITAGISQKGIREAFYAKGLTESHIFKLTAEMNLPSGCHNGLVFSGNTQGEYYVFLVSETSYTVEILRRKGNDDLPREAIIPDTDVPQSIGKPHILTVLSDGSRYFFYINSVYVNEMSDTRLNGNRVGVEAYT